MPTSERKRLHFVDVLRLIALLQMVNGHTLHAVLSPALRHGAVYAGYLWFRGLVSVAFMLVAGVAFYLTTVARPEAHTPAERQRRVRRALEIIAVGLLLRLPLTAILSDDARAIARALSSLAQVDVLPCIGVSLLVLEGVLALLSVQRAVVWASAALCIASAFAAGWGATLPTALPLGYLTGWLGPQGGSSFPLLPYGGYVFAGVVLGGVSLPLGAATPAARAAARLALAAAALWIVSKLFEHIPTAWLGARGPLIHTPAFFMLKLSVVALAAGVLAFATRRLTKLPPSLATLTAETLGVYVFHLFVLYGSPIALARRIGSTLDLPHALGVSVAMVVASFAFGLGWRRLKSLPLARRRWPMVRTAAIGIASLWTAILAFPLAALGEATEPRVLSVSLPVTELEAAEHFFTALGFHPDGRTRTLAGEAFERVTGAEGVRASSRALQLGRERIDLVAFDPPGRPIPSDSRSDDAWFQHLALVTRDLDVTHRQLTAASVSAISSAPQTLPFSNPAAAGIRAFYFHGPALHPLELISYPPGKGDPRWQHPGAGNVLGIDHTAIVVSDTARSKRFYTELLGLHGRRGDAHDREPLHETRHALVRRRSGRDSERPRAGCIRARRAGGDGALRARDRAAPRAREGGALRSGQALVADRGDRGRAQGAWCATAADRARGLGSARS